MNFLRLIKRFWQALPLSDHTRWRISVLLLEPILPLIKGSVVHSAYQREKEWQTKRIRPFHGDHLPVLPMQTKTDIIIWGIIDWRFRIQRPQHLAQGLAEKGYRVFYISTAFVNTSRPGFELESMDDAGLLYNVRLHLKGRPAVYAAPARPDELRRLKENVAKLLEWTNSQGIVSLVQHPYWHTLSRKLPNSRFIYDCMDHHDGFGNTGEGIAALESSLLKEADAVITTSQWLYDVATAHNRCVSIIRNAADADFFSTTPKTKFSDPLGRRVIGYYGAIAGWMDIDLLKKVALHFSDCLLLLVGADEVGAHQQLSGLQNVRFTGEVNYKQLPYYLYGMDVCLLPFRVTPLTLATNPVKVYEYLAAGKPVVSIELPELKQFEGHVAVAATHDVFLTKISTALSDPCNNDLIAARQAFASRNSWSNRVAQLDALITTLPTQKISVVIVTHNNLELTRNCLDSLEYSNDYSDIEVIVVDNASDDGTIEYLQTWTQSGEQRHIILNTDNRGFAAANNQGLAVARGEYLVLLNNDTEVTPGWLRTMMNHLRLDNTLGMIGPVTNNIGNEARIRIRYKNSDEMRQFSRGYTLRHLGESFPIRTLAFFCVMMPRAIYEQIGPLDEAYGLGFFEDDDYCRRLEQAGWRIECAEDVFIHHHLSASFNKLGKGRKELLERNKRIYEAKWGAWTPHKQR